MTTTSPPVPLAPDTWQLSRRIEAWAGEIRVNLIRILAIAIFYARHLIELLLSPADSQVRGVYHLRVTALIVAWAGAACVIHLLLSRRFYPPAMKYATAVLDVLMITVLCAIAGTPQSPLTLLFFAVIASAPLRLSLELVYVTTSGAILGYLAVLGYYVFHVIGWNRYYSRPEVRIPRSTEVIFVLSLLVSGLFAGQIVRQVRRMIERQPLLTGTGGPRQ
jgi:hypothetical protein